MPSSKLRVDYEELTQIARAFGREAEAVQGVSGRLERAKRELEGGKWKGKGAAAFYGEMNATVMPAMERLSAALTEAASVTRAVSRIMKRAEDDAAALFRLDGQATDAREPGDGAGVSRFSPEEESPGRSATSGPGTGQPARTKPRGRVIRVEHPQKKHRRRPPGPGAYTEAEYQDWRRRYPNAETRHVPAGAGGRTKEKKYTPEELWWAGYYYAKTVVEESWTYEVWLSDEGKGKVLDIYVRVD